MNGRRRYSIACALTSLVLLFATGHVSAGPNNPRIIYSFCPYGEQCPAGKYPTNLVRGLDGDFYGATMEGGLQDGGVVFRVDPVTQVYSVVHRFDSRSEGANPAWITIGSDGNFYGALSHGGSTGFGNLFRLTPAGEFTELHPFDQYNLTNGPMVEDGEGNWYGLMLDNGPGGTGYSAYKITSDGIFSVLYTFGLKISKLSAGIVLASDGNLYGTTGDGSGQHDNGMAYRLTRDGEFTELYEFVPVSETEPNVPCTGPDSALYGLVRQGTIGLSMYRIDLDGHVTVQPVVSDGYYPYPQEPLTLMPDGNFYGTHFGDPYLVFFRLSASGEFREIYGIPHGVIINLFPTPLVRGFRDDALYGVADVGGKQDNGIIFRLIAPPAQ